MTDLDPAIWENKTLGSVTPNKNLEVVTRQDLENHAAKVEGREPREIVTDNNYPGWTPPVQERTGTVPSNAIATRYADQESYEAVQSGEDVQPEGISDAEWNGETEEPDGDDPEATYPEKGETSALAPDLSSESGNE